MDLFDGSLLVAVCWTCFNIEDHISRSGSIELSLMFEESEFCALRYGAMWKKTEKNVFNIIKYAIIKCV